MTTSEKPPRLSDPELGIPGPRRRVGVAEALRRHWPVAAVPVLIFVMLAIVISWARTPVFTAEARLNVGGTDLPTESVSNFVIGTQTLAATYSRLVTANEVLLGASEASGIPPEEVYGKVDASPIPESSVFRVEARAATADDAVVLANAAAESLIAFVGERGRDTAETRRLAGLVRTAAEDVENAQTAGAREEARLRLETYRTLYSEQVTSSASGSTVQVLNPAGTATSDRSSVLQRLGFVGLIGGLAVGITLASIRANSDRPRGGLRHSRSRSS